MADAATRIHVEGVGTCIYQLTQIERKVRNRTIRNATRAAAKVLRDEVRLITPKKSGLLKRSIKMSVRMRNGKVTAKVGQEKQYRSKRGAKRGSSINKRGYAAPIYWIERGTEPHTIEASKGKRLAVGSDSKKRGRMAFPVSVAHPGTKPQRILERARKASQSKAGRAWYAVVKAELTDLPELTGGTA